MKKRLLTLLTAFTLLMSVLVVPINAVADTSARYDKYSSYVYNDYMSSEFYNDYITIYNSTFNIDGVCIFDLGSPALFNFFASSDNIIVLVWTADAEGDHLLCVGYPEELRFDLDNSCRFNQIENTNEKVYRLYDYFESRNKSAYYNFTFIRDNAVNTFELLQLFYQGDIDFNVTDKEAKISGCSDSSITTLYIPETLYGKPVTTLESFAFSYLPELTTVYLPDSLKFIYASCFAYCSKLESVSIGGNVEFIGSSCFAGTPFQNMVVSRDNSRSYFLKSNVTSGETFAVPEGTVVLAGGSLRNTSFGYVSFPKELEIIGPKVFYQNSSTAIYDFSHCKKIPAILSDSFDVSLLASSQAKIIVPGGLYDEWLTYSNWHLFSAYIVPLNYWTVYEQGYFDGNNVGTHNGHQLGYAQGKADGIAEGTEAGYQSGYLQGKTDGITEGSQSGYTSGYQGGYNDGIIKGQKDSDIVEKGINGFFIGLTSFFAPFFSLGFGGITVASLLGLAITVFIIILIYKLTRG